MSEKPPIVVLIVVLIVAMGCFCHSCGKVDIEKQAISQGYATYDANGVFQWKEQKK